jgi:hypothetical protein
MGYRVEIASLLRQLRNRILSVKKSDDHQHTPPGENVNLGSVKKGWGDCWQ